MAVKKNPLKSEFGFVSPNFSIDEQGNITANSISTTVPITGTGGGGGTTVVEGDTTIVIGADYSLTDTQGSFRIAGIIGNNPTITMFRGETYRFNLNLDEGLTFNIFESGTTTFYSQGLSHNSGDIGDNAQGKIDGVITFTVPADAPNVLVYADADGFPFANITILDQQLYGNATLKNLSATQIVNFTRELDSTLTTNGAVTIAGGVGIEKNVNLGGTLGVNSISNADSGTSIDINSATAVNIAINNSTKLTVNSSGIVLTQVDINGGSIDGTTIGAAVQASAAFTEATINNKPSQTNQATRKDYVDATATALAVALGG